MNWIKANPFLTGFFAAMLIGIGALGYLLTSAKGAFEAASDNYASQVSELDRLRHLPLFPNAKNLGALEAQKTDASRAIVAFQIDLAKREFPLEPMTPDQFQEKLKASVSAVRAKAASAGVALPKEKFFLGFEVYEGRPPEAAAATPLGRQLKAIEWVVNDLISNQVSEVRTLVRTELPEEHSGRPQEGAGGAGPNRRDRPGKQLVSKYPFDISVFSSQRAIATALNDIVGPKAPQFYIPRMIQVKNEQSVAPKRAGANAAGVPGAPGAAPEPTPPAGTSAGNASQIASYIAGNERIETYLRLEIVDFAEPAAK